MVERLKVYSSLTSTQKLIGRRSETASVEVLGVPKLKFERMATSDGSVVGVMRPEPEASTSMAEDSGKLSREKLK